MCHAVNRSTRDCLASSAELAVAGVLLRQKPSHVRLGRQAGIAQIHRGHRPAGRQPQQVAADSAADFGHWLSGGKQPGLVTGNIEIGRLLNRLREKNIFCASGNLPAAPASSICSSAKWTRSGENRRFKRSANAAREPACRLNSASSPEPSGPTSQRMSSGEMEVFNAGDKRGWGEGADCIRYASWAMPVAAERKNSPGLASASGHEAESPCVRIIRVERIGQSKSLRRGWRKRQPVQNRIKTKGRSCLALKFMSRGFVDRRAIITRRVSEAASYQPPSHARRVDERLMN